MVRFKLEKKEERSEEVVANEVEGVVATQLMVKAITTSQTIEQTEALEKEKLPVHNEGENMSSFILIEKSRLKGSQKALKQKVHGLISFEDEQVAV